MPAAKPSIKIKPPKPEVWVILVIMPILLFVTVLFVALDRYGQPSVIIHSDNGVWDLRGLSFDNGERYGLRGDIQYIAGALLTPSEFAARESEAVYGSSPLKEAQSGTTRAVILTDGGYYAFTARSIDYAWRVFVNGEMLIEAGSPGESAQTNTADTKRVYLTLKPEDGKIEIVTHETNYVHREAGGYGVWTVSGPDMSTELSGGYYSSIILGCYLALFVIHTVLYALMRSYKANLYFALFCLVWFMRSGVTYHLIFSNIFPWLSWAAKFRMEYISLPVTAFLMVSLLNILFPGILHKWFRVVIYGVSVFFACIFLFAGTVFMSRVMLYSQAAYAAAIVYIAARFVMKLRRPAIGQIVFLSGFGFFLITAVADMLNVLGVRSDLIPRSTTAMLLLTFYQATAVFIGTMTEIEKVKAAEQQLAAENTALERVNKLRTDLMATISHEARTPLAVLASYSGLVAMELRARAQAALLQPDAQTPQENLEQTAADLDTIVAEAKRVAGLIDSMKKLAGLDTDKIKRINLDIGEVIRNTTGLYRHIIERGGIKFTVRIPDGLPRVFASPEEITQVIFNLMQNAKNHTESGSITVAAKNADGRITVWVTDTGRGIPAELLAVVFERGVSGSGGSGIGLALCREIIESCGGAVAIESEENRGTTVMFTLPAVI